MKISTQNLLSILSSTILLLVACDVNDEPEAVSPRTNVQRKLSTAPTKPERRPGDGAAFDLTTPNDPCDVWVQDCGPGQKCTILSDGGPGCVRVHPNAGEVDDPCEDLGDEGDTCVFGATCRDDLCIHLASGSPEDPKCPTHTAPVVSDGALLGVCLPSCGFSGSDTIFGQGRECLRVPERAAGETCGGLPWLPCLEGLYCNFAVSARCGAGDMTGTCSSKPEFCAKEYAPVCGCDGETYASECLAAMAGVSIVSTGACGS